MVCVTYVVLLLLLRSAWLPLKAVLVNSLSIMASFGALVFIFQQGHLSGVLNFVPEGYVDATLPVIMFCTLFGVSMDYEVFLLTRMREAWLATARQPPGGRLWPGAHRPHHHERGAHHRHRRGLVRHDQHPHHQGDRRGPGGRHRARRDHHPRAAGAGHHAPRRLDQLVAALITGARFAEDG